MVAPTAIVRTLSADKFLELLGASPRQARETFFKRHRIKRPKTSGLPRAGAGQAARARKLLEALQEREDDEMAEEVIRNWLFTKRPMLCAALDHLGIEHQDGITDSEDLSKMQDLKGKALQQLVAHLEENETSEDVAIYLRYMGIEL